MSGRNTAILVGILAALCLGYWFMLRTEKRAEVQEEAAKQLFDFEPQEIEEVSVARSNDVPVVAKREGDRWSIAAPHPVAADQARWKKIAETFAGLIKERTVAEADADMAAYELDKPRLVVRARAKGKEWPVAFGKVIPTQDYRYARLGDGPVFLVPDGTYRELDYPLTELRDRSMIRAGDKGITRFEFSHVVPPSDAPDTALDPVKVVVEKREDGRWYTVTPVEGAADQEIVSYLVTALQMAPGKDFVDAPESLTDYGLDPARVQITAWTGADSKPQTVYFGALQQKEGEEPGLFVKRADEPSVFVTSANMLALFPEKPDSFRDRHLLTHAATDIKRMRYRASGTDVILENDKDKGWQLVQPPAGDTDQEAVSAFIALLKGMTSDEFVADPSVATGLDNPLVRFDMTLKEGKEIAVAVGGPAPGEEKVYGLQDTGSVVILPSIQLSGMTVDDFYFRSKEIYKFPEDKADRIVLNFDGIDYVFERDEAGDWAVKSPANKRWELQSDMKALLGALNPVKAVTVESPEPPADAAVYGLDAPVLTAEAVTLEGGNEKRMGLIRVGQPTPDNSHERFAVVEGRPEVFRVRQSLVEDVREALRGVRDR